MKKVEPSFKNYKLCENYQTIEKYKKMGQMKDLGAANYSVSIL